MSATRILILAAATGLAVACSARPREEPAAQREATASVAGYTDTLARLDRELNEAERLADARDGWADLELVAKLRMRRARLSGSFDDWIAAERALAQAFAIAPEGGGPRLTELELELALHRLGEAERGIEALTHTAVVLPALRRELSLRQGELAAQRGQLDTAQAAFERATELGTKPEAIAPRLALLDRRRGAFARARTTLSELASQHEGQPRAWLLVQAGLAEWTGGDAAAALELYEQAEAAFPGWWLVEEHRAEAMAALGRTTEAEALYRAVIERTQNPEFMDALVELLRETGRESEAAPWIQQAKAGHEGRMAELPEAAGAHALDHLVRFEPEAAETLARVRAAAAAAPHEDNLRRLARICLIHGQPAEARAALERARSQGAASPELDDLLGQLGSSQ